MAKTVTIGIPVFNVERYVRESLLSALNQTYADIEFLIVDDRGQDQSMSIVRQLVAEHPRGSAVRIIENEKNVGIAATRNTIIDEAQGSYLFFLDSDDVISPDCIALHVHYLEQYQCDFVCGSSVYVFQNGDKAIYTQYRELVVVGGEEYCVVKRYCSHDNTINVLVCNKLYRKDFLISNGIRCAPGLVHEDVWFTWLLILSARSCVLMPAVTYQYYERHASICNDSATEAVTKRHYDRGQMLEMMVSSVKAHTGLPRTIRQLLAIRMIRKALSYSKAVVSEQTLSSVDKKRLTLRNTSNGLGLFTCWSMDFRKNLEMLRCLTRLMLFRLSIK